MTHIVDICEMRCLPGEGGRGGVVVIIYRIASFDVLSADRDNERCSIPAANHGRHHGFEMGWRLYHTSALSFAP